MNNYEIKLKDHSWFDIDDNYKCDKGITETFFAETPSKAKYQMFLYTNDMWEYTDGFKGFLKDVEYCRKIKFDESSSFKIDQFNHMKEMRNIKFAYIGMKVIVNGKEGIIVGSNGSLNLDVMFEGYNGPCNCHPYWKTKYIDSEGNVLKEFER